MYCHDRKKTIWDHKDSKWLSLTRRIFYWRINCTASKVQTTNLNIFRESSKDLFGNLESLKEALPAWEIDDVIVGVVPVEVRDGLLETEQEVHRGDNDIHGRGVAGLSPQVVLEVLIVSLAEELEESEERDGEWTVMEDLTHSCTERGRE